MSEILEVGMQNNIVLVALTELLNQGVERK